MINFTKWFAIVHKWKKSISAAAKGDESDFLHLHYYCMEENVDKVTPRQRAAKSDKFAGGREHKRISSIFHSF
jgi:hypothetical protein